MTGVLTLVIGNNTPGGLRLVARSPSSRFRTVV
jgi:hypothetical protein